jgi:hypothetical protein
MPDQLLAGTQTKNRRGVPLSDAAVRSGRDFERHSRRRRNLDHGARGIGHVRIYPTIGRPELSVRLWMPSYMDVFPLRLRAGQVLMVLRD